MCWFQRGSALDLFQATSQCQREILVPRMNESIHPKLLAMLNVIAFEKKLLIDFLDKGIELKSSCTMEEIGYKAGKG